MASPSVSESAPAAPLAAGPPAIAPLARAAGRVAIGALPYVATSAIVLAIGLPTVILPFWYDTAIFALVGQTIADGGVPYVDAWDQKPPAIYLLYAAALRGPFSLTANVRAFDLAWTVLTVCALIALGRRWWSVRAGVIAGLLYGGVYLASSTWTQLAQPDSFVGLPLVLALLLCHAARGRWALLVAAGAMLGVAFQLRAIVALLVPVAPLVEVLEAPPGRRLRGWLATMCWMGAGFVVVQAAFAAYLAAGGALGEYIAATRFATGYTRVGGPWQGAEGPTLGGYLQALRLSFPHWAVGRLVLTAPAVAGGFAGAVLLRDRRVQQLVLLSVLAYAGIATQGKFFWYHYWYMLPFLALLAGWAWDRALAHLFRVWPRVPAATFGAVAFFGLLLATPEMTDTGWTQWRWYLESRRDPTFAAWLAWSAAPAAHQTADHVRTRTEPGERFFVWGYDPVVYLLAERPPASRFIYALPFMSDWAPRAWLAEFLAEMEADPPAYFITQHNQGGPWIVGHTVDPADYVAWIPELDAWLRATYERETRIGDFVLYRRRAARD